MTEQKSIDPFEFMNSIEDDVSLTYARAEGIDPVTHDAREVTVILSFSERNFGFGEIAIKQTQSGVFMDTEHMSMERVKKYFNMLLDSAILDTDQDPKRHMQYNLIMGRRCGGGCTVCNEAGDE